MDINHSLITGSRDNHVPILVVRLKSRRHLARAPKNIGAWLFNRMKQGLLLLEIVWILDPFKPALAGAIARPSGQSCLKNFPVVIVSTRALIGSGLLPLA